MDMVFNFTHVYKHLKYIRCICMLETKFFKNFNLDWLFQRNLFVVTLTFA